MWNLFKTPWNLPVEKEAPKKSQPEIQTEPVIGWRAWYLDKAKGALYSSTRRILWPFRKALEADDPNWWMEDSCNGIHGHKFRKMAPIYANQSYATVSDPAAVEFHPCVIGSIFMWGRVIEHSQGYRSEFAYPRSICVPENCDAALVMLLEDNYGVPVEFTEEIYWPTIEQIQNDEYSAKAMAIYALLYGHRVFTATVPSQLPRLRRGSIIPSPTILLGPATTSDTDKGKS